MALSSRWLFVIAAVASATLIYIYPLSLRTPLLDPDEGLHATIAQEMVEGGDYLVPRFCGEPFRDKPIFYFAAEAASLRIFGMNEAAVRLPGLMFALLGCLTTTLLAWRLFDREIAGFSLLAALTLVLPVMLAQSPTHDIALVPSITCFVLCFWEQDETTDAKTRRRWLLGGAVCVALALLTKGLIGIAVVSVGIGLYSLLARRLSGKLILRAATVVLLGGALASPWFLWMEHASPGYLYYYFIDRHLLGFVTAGQQHGESPWYYYLGPVLGGAMPWLLYAVAAVAQLWQDGRQSTASRATLLLADWFVGGFLFLNLAGSKLLTYSLPLFPPIAVLAAVAFSRYCHGTLAPPIRKAVTASFRCCCVVGILAPAASLLIIKRYLGAPSPPVAYAVALIASALMAVSLLEFERGSMRNALIVGVLWFPVTIVALLTWPLQSLADSHSQRNLARQISARTELPEQVVLLGERIGSLMFYLTPEQRTWFRQNRVREGLYEELARVAVEPGCVVAATGKELRQASLKKEVAQLSSAKCGRFYLIDSTLTTAAKDRRNATHYR